MEESVCAEEKSGTDSQSPASPPSVLVGIRVCYTARRLVTHTHTHRVGEGENIYISIQSWEKEKNPPPSFPTELLLPSPAGFLSKASTRTEIRGILDPTLLDLSCGPLEFRRAAIHHVFLLLPPHTSSLFLSVCVCVRVSVCNTRVCVCV